MQLVCPQCSAKIRGEDINLAVAIARCASCSAVFAFSAAQLGRPVMPVSMPRPLAPKPAHLTVDDSGHDLKIWWNWLHCGLIPMALFALVWNGFLVVWYGLAFGVIANQGGGGNNGFWIMVLFPLLHVAVGVSIGYSTLMGLLNTTTVEFADGMVRVRIGPLPWFGNVELDARSIKQLYCSTSTGQAVSFNLSPRTAHFSFELAALLVDGTKAVLVGGQSDPDTVRFIEQTLEKKLKIEDERVGGEYLG